MNPAITFGLLTALLYGVSDFFAKFSGRAVGVWRTLFWGQLCSAGLLSLWLGLNTLPRAALHAQPADWALAIGSNLTILAATAVFYRALTIGSFAVVAPIVAIYGAITALLSGLLGESLGALTVIGIAVCVGGGVAASVPRRDEHGPADGGQPASTQPASTQPAGRAGRGSGLAALAALLYGAGFCVQARFVVPSLGHLVPVWLYYALGSALLGVVALATGRDLSPPRPGQIPVVLATGLAASAAFVALTLAVSGGDVAVPAVLASLASVVTVVLARVLVREQVALHQWGGIAAVVAGLALLHAN